MVHKFAQGGLFFVLDINSGAVHMVDEIVYDVLSYYPKESALTAIRALLDRYEESEIREALEEIDALIEAEQLYTDGAYIGEVQLNTRAPIIKALCLHVAHDCNIRCKYCFASQGDFNMVRGLMPLEVGKAALDFLIAHSGNRRNLEVDFFGGEPLMNFEVVKELVHYGRRIEKEHGKNFRFTITTNGMLLDDDKIDFINEHMSNAVLSIDGRREVNDFMRPTVSGGGTYDVIVDKFRRLVEKRGAKSYYVRGTYTAHNTDFSKDVKHLADLGFRSTSVEPVVAKETDAYALKAEDLPKLLHEYELLAEEMIQGHEKGKPFDFFHFSVDLSQGPCVVKRLSGCGAGSEYIAVTPEGDIYPCHQFVGDTDFKLGNVMSGEFEMRESFRDAHILNKQKCRHCWAKFYCSGGCHANAYNFNGDILEPHEMSCELEKKRIECSIYIQGRLSEQEADDDQSL